MAPISTPARTATLDVGDAQLHCELRGDGPLLVLVGAPMHADAFAPLADLLAADHTVLTTDPRGINRSPLADPEQDSTPELRAQDVSRLIEHVQAGPAAVLGSSGGAVTALALAQAATAPVHTVVAHEHPSYALLDDRAQRDAGVEDMIATHARGDRSGAWAKFLANANISMPPEVVEQVFGGESTPQELADEHYSFAHMLRGTTRWEPNLDTLRDGPTRIVIGIGEESSGQLCDRTSRALAAALGLEPTIFCGGHLGFAEEPDRFAGQLRAVLGDA